MTNRFTYGAKFVLDSTVLGLGDMKLQIVWDYKKEIGLLLLFTWNYLERRSCGMLNGPGAYFDHNCFMLILG